MNIHTCMHACIHMMHASHTSIKKEVDKRREKEKSFSTCQGLGFQFPNAVEPCPATALVVFFFFFGLRIVREKMKEMKGAGDSSSEGSKTTSFSNQKGEEGEEEEVDDDKKTKNGGSSSNSTVEESERKAGSGSVRRYVRSKMPRLRWTPDLHLCFLHAVERLGGQDRATPKLVLQLMDIKGLSISHVKSHLQMYRSKKIDDPNQVMMEQGLFIEGGDHHIYKLSHLPMLQSFNRRPATSGFRYDSASASWRASMANQTYSPYRGGDASDRSKNGGYSSVSERIFRSNKGSSVLNYEFHLGNSSFNGQAAWNNAHHTREEFQLYSHSHGSWRTQIRPSSIQSNYLQPQVLESRKQQVNRLNNPPPPQENQKTMLKRKSSDSNFDLDLNLSLKPAPKSHDHHLEKMDNTEIDSSLSLSLFSPPPSKLSRVKEGDGSRKHAEGASTLDLTL